MLPASSAVVQLVRGSYEDHKDNFERSLLKMQPAPAIQTRHMCCLFWRAKFLSIFHSRESHRLALEIALDHLDARVCTHSSDRISSKFCIVTNLVWKYVIIDVFDTAV